MKRIIFSILTLLITGLAFAQAPQSFNYQAIARNATGAPLANQAISVRLSITDSVTAGNILYSETHGVTTNTYGLFTLSVGTGTVVSGTFSGVNWAGGSRFLKVEMDASGGSSYTLMGVSQLLSVPYALYAAKSGSQAIAGKGISIQGDTITNASPNQTVTLTGKGAATVSGAYPNYIIHSDSAIIYNAGNGIIIRNDSIINSVNQVKYNAGNGITISNDSIINTAPNQVVSLTGKGDATVSGSYPNFTVHADSSITYNAGNGITISNDSIINTAPNQIVSLTGKGDATVGGTYPNFTVHADSSITYNAGNGIAISNDSIINTAPGNWTLTGNNIQNSNSGSVSVGTNNTPALFNVNGNAVIGTGLIQRANKGLTIDYIDTNMYIPNADITDGSRVLSIVNEGNTNNGMAVLSMRNNANTTNGGINQMLDMKFINPNDGTSKLIYSFGPSGSFTDAYTFENGGNFGIGKTNPNHGLDAANGINTDSAYMIGGNTVLFSNSSGLILGNGANVGIGTSSPASKLEVNGNVKIDSLAGTGTRIVSTDSVGNLGTIKAGNGISIKNDTISIAAPTTYNPYGPKFITPDTIYALTDSTIQTWYTIDASKLIPAGATTVILDLFGNGTPCGIRIRKNISSPLYWLYTSDVTQGAFPIDNNRTFEINVNTKGGTLSGLRIIGYY